METIRHSHEELLERIVTSQYFQSSARLKDFLLYVTDCARRGATEEATEQHIGIHVFQRQPGYNSAEDGIVRTHARLLRQKLSEYFRNEGSQEETIIEVPKGHYMPVFLPRVQAAQAPPVVATPAKEPLKDKQRKHQKKRWLLVFLLLMAAGIVGAVRWNLHRQRSREHSAIERFWGPFFAGNDSFVVYSNALFVDHPNHGLYYAPVGADIQQSKKENYVDSYTGVGEVASIYYLTRIFDSHHATFTLKRSRLVGWDDAKLKNLIFVGSTLENPTLRDLPDNADFTLSPAGIVNHHPRQGELDFYSVSKNSPTWDYAIVALLPGPTPGHTTLVFSGITTMGTQAAVEFACRPGSLEQLLHFATGTDGAVHPFEAVLKTTLAGGEPLETRLVTVHVRGRHL